MMCLKVSWTTLLVCMLCSCAMAFGPRFSEVRPTSGQALVYVYRAATISGAAMSAKPMVVVNGKEYRTIKIGGYFPIRLEPGEHQIGLRASIFGHAVGGVRSSIAFEIAPGEVKYFEYAQITQGYKKYGDTDVAEVKEYFMEVPALYGKKVIEKTRLLNY